MLTVVRRCSLLCVVSVVIFACSSVNAANLTWDSDLVPPVTDGSGFWDTLPTNTFWFNGTSDIVWNNASTAVFGAGNGTAPYTVTIDDASGTVTATGLTFNSAGTGNYTIATNGVDTLTLSGTNPVITLGAGVNAAISAPITGSFGSSTGTNNTTGLIIKSTGGNNTSVLTLTGVNTYSGSTVIESNGTANMGTAVALTGGSIGSAGSNFYIAFNPTAAATDTSSLTMSGTSSITAATLTLDYNFGEGAIDTATGGTLNVNGANTINANTIITTDGRHSGNTKGGLGTLKLGTGATLTLNGSAGTGNNVNLLDIADYNFESGGTTGTGSSGVVDFSAGTVNGTINTVNIATGKALGTGAGGVSNGSLLFSNGTLTASTINIARIGSQPAAGTLTLAAGGTGTINTSSIIFGALVAAGGNLNATNSKATGVININGGTLSLSGSITTNPNGLTQYTSSGSTATINLNGGTLAMNGNSIGDGSNSVTLNATAGTLSNLSLINGTGGVTMSGTGAQVLTLIGTNSYSGNTTVNGGTLVANGAQSMGTGSGALAVNGGTLDLDGFSQSVAGLSGTGATGVITNNGVSSPVTLTVTGGTGTYAGIIKDGTSSVGLTVNSGAIVNLTSATAHTYSGNTTLGNGATLTIANINSNSNVSDNGTLAANGTVGSLTLDQAGFLTPGPTVASNTTGALSVKNLTIGASGGSMNFLLNSASAFDQLTVSPTGTVTFNGNLTVNATISASLTAGIYTLVSASNGGIIPADVIPGTISVLGGGGAATRISGLFQETSTAIQLNVSGGAANLAWTDGTHNTNWGTTQTDANWLRTDAGTAGLSNQFYNGDNVTFDSPHNTDTPPNYTVNITGPVQPGSVLFTNGSSSNYTISSANSNGIGGATGLTVNSSDNTGTVTLNTVNTYTGNTTVTAGTLVIGGTGAIAGGTLSVASGAATTVNSGGSVTTSTINISGGLTVGGSVAGTTMALSSPANVQVTSTGNLSTPTVNVNGGALTVQSSGTLSSTALSVASGAALTVQAGGSVSATPSLVNNGSVILGAGQNFGALSGTNSSATINVNGTLGVAGNGTYAGTIIDNSPTNQGSLTVSSGTLTLTGANTYSGATTVNTGATLQVDTGSNTGSLSSTSVFNINGTLIYDRAGNLSLGNTLTGSGGAFRQLGGGNLTLTGANSGYSSDIQVYNGTVTQGSTNANTLGSGSGGLVIGTPATSATTTPVGSVVLSSAIPATSVGSISSTSGSTTASPTPNTIVIPTGVALTDTGNFTVGPGQGVFTTLAATGGGSLVINGNVAIGGANDTAITDLSALNSVTISDTTLSIGGSSPSIGTLTLANTTVGVNAPVNTISTATLNLSTTGTSTPGAASVLNLGSGINTINATTINLGTGRGAGVIQFIAGAPSTATLAITGNPTINMALANTNGVQTSITAVMNLAGYSVNVQAGSIGMANETANLDGGSSASITFDTGTFTVGTITMAGDTGGSSLIGPTATLTIGGATPNNTATGVFNSSNIVLGNFTNTNAFAVASAVANATLTINGGTANVSGNITNNSNHGTTNSTLTLAGGTLNMSGFSVGGAGGVNSGNGPITVNLPGIGQKATLSNLGGGGINGAGLTMNGGGTLILAGSNSYNSGTGNSTTVTLGNLVLGSANSIDGAGGGVILAGGNFGTGGFNQNVPGSLTLSSSAHLDLGLGGQGPIASVTQGNVHFSASSTTNQAITWTGTLTVDNWTPGIDHLFFGSDNTGLDPSQVSDITFAGFGAAQITATGEIIPLAATPTFVLGDVNDDGHYDARDILAEEKALANVGFYQSAAGNPYGINLTTDELDAVLDQNHDGVINNADLQALLNNLLGGQGSTSTVPEPTGIVLISLGGILLAAYRRRKASSSVGRVES